jgi:hypothetical protein
MNVFAAALALALMVPVPGSGPAPAPRPSGSPNPAPLKTIVTVRSNPFCTSLVTHFNLSVQPMVANDATLDQVDTQLVDLKAIFASPDYVQQFYKFRTKLGLFVEQMQKRLPPMQQQINQLRDGEKLADNPADAKRIHALAEKMQLAYNKQMQLVTDLYGVVQGSMDYQPLDAPHPLNGQDPEELARPADEKDLKSYLRFDGQRDVISQSEEAAGDIAYDVATTRCQ